MAQTIVMPRFGATMEEGTITSWSVKEGDVVSKGAVLGEIEIEKLTNELLAEADGVILKILAPAGDTLACGTPILLMGEAGERVETPVVAQKAAENKAIDPPRPSTGGQNGGQPKPGPSASYQESAQITPKGLQLANELGIDYHFMRGTGRFGMVTREDIRLAQENGTLPKGERTAVQTPVTGETRKMNQMELTIAKAMEASLKNTAQTTISMDLDASMMVKAYQNHKEEYQKKGIKLTYTAILIKLVAAALIEHKLLRTVIVENNLMTKTEINIGIAIDIGDGLVVPNIKNAPQKNIRTIAVELENLGKQAKANTLSLDDISGGVFTITNLGSFGIKYFTPVLNTGESGILGVGTIQEVPYVKDGGIFIRPVINLSLTHDHRVVNGAPGARFLQTIQQNMNQCESIFMD